MMRNPEPTAEGVFFAPDVRAKLGTLVPPGTVVRLHAPGPSLANANLRLRLGVPGNFLLSDKSGPADAPVLVAGNGTELVRFLESEADTSVIFLMTGPVLPAEWSKAHARVRYCLGDGEAALARRSAELSGAIRELGGGLLYVLSVPNPDAPAAMRLLRECVALSPLLSGSTDPALRSRFLAWCFHAACLIPDGCPEGLADNPSRVLRECPEAGPDTLAEAMTGIWDLAWGDARTRTDEGLARFSLFFKDPLDIR